MKNGSNDLLSQKLVWFAMFGGGGENMWRLAPRNWNVQISSVNNEKRQAEGYYLTFFPLTLSLGQG